jgi:allantoicase
VSDWSELTDLASTRLGGMVLAANDEFFAPKERLLEPAAPVFVPGRYTDRGKWMDGWETRRRRDPGHDWCVVRLGVPGVVRGVVVDTTHFRGNQPEAFSLDGLAADAREPADLAGAPAGADAGGAGPPPPVLGPDAGWLPLVGRTPLEADAEQRFAVDAPFRATHVRLSIHPDGGVARLRLHGEPLPDLRALAGPGGRLDLAAATSGGDAVAASEETFASRHHLIAPGDAVDMGDGWETRRRRGPGHDWAVVRLGAEGVVERVELDTTHYKGNHPDRAALEGCDAPDTGITEVPSGGWWTLVPESRLRPHARHVFAVADPRPVSHVRLAIHPDGGVSRLRVLGRIGEAGWRRWGVRWLNALPAGQAEAELLACCGSREWARQVVAARPWPGWEELGAAADRVWAGLGRDDWLQAFAAHPRIGERAPATAAPDRGTGWSGREQAGVAAADAAVLAGLAEGNRDYEARFGHVFLVCASGRGAGELLDELRRRLGNDPATELRVAAEEQRKITRLRLDKLVRPPDG